MNPTAEDRLSAVRELLRSYISPNDYSRAATILNQLFVELNVNVTPQGQVLLLLEAITNGIRTGNWPWVIYEHRRNGILPPRARFAALLH
jgi:hypothetical protein